MNYLFRPTPVVVLGRDRGADQVHMVKPPAGVMYGVPHSSGRPSRSLATQGAPWIVRSGTMASFGTLGQNILGQDDGIDTTMYDPGSDLIAPTDAGIGVSTTPLDLLPSFPAPTPIDTSMYSAPNTLTPPTFAPIQQPLNLLPSVPAGAGPTGQSIPGTQPVNAAVTGGASILQSIANLFKPSTPATSIKLPGVGVNPNLPAPSFLAQSSILPGTPNSTVLFGGAAALILVAVLLGGKGK